jgi:hypothetical protein
MDRISEGLAQRDAISRAELFLVLAEQCDVNHRELFEAFLEASIIFGRAAVHRMQSGLEQHAQGKSWLKSLPLDGAIKFFRDYRNDILKEGPPKLGQIISFSPIRMASELYYFESPDIPATVTLRTNLGTIAGLVREAKARFSVA